MERRNRASAAEYALILAIVGTAIAAAAIFLGRVIGTEINETANCIASEGVTCSTLRPGRDLVLADLSYIACRQLLPRGAVDAQTILDRPGGFPVFFGSIAVYLVNAYLTGAERKQEARVIQTTRIAVARVPLQFGARPTPQNTQFVEWPVNSVP